MFLGFVIHEAWPACVATQGFFSQTDCRRSRRTPSGMPGYSGVASRRARLARRLGDRRGIIWTVPPTREREGPNPKPEIRGPKEGRNPKSDIPEHGFGLQYSALFRVSALGIRIWAAGGGWYCPPDRRPVRLTFLAGEGPLGRVSRMLRDATPFA